MQNQLIPVVSHAVGSETIPTVNARELHTFLKVGKEFANWIKDRIESFGFVENQDFVVIAESGKNPSGGRPVKNYHLTLDMAKELSMVERNAKGKQARQYFIECEKTAKQSVPVASANNQVMQFLEGTLAALKSHEAAIAQVTSAVESVQSSVTTLTETMRMHQWQCYELKAAVTQKAQELHERYKVHYPLLFPGIWNFVKRHFRVTTYGAIPAVRFGEALLIVRGIELEQLPDYVQGQAQGVTK